MASKILHLITKHAIYFTSSIRNAEQNQTSVFPEAIVDPYKNEYVPLKKQSCKAYGEEHTVIPQKAAEYKKNKGAGANNAGKRKEGTETSLTKQVGARREGDRADA